MTYAKELRERIAKTKALIVQLREDSIAATAETPPSVLASVRALEKLRKRLEAELREFSDGAR